VSGSTSVLQPALLAKQKSLSLAQEAFLGGGRPGLGPSS
jgi:hypothetical protein